MPKGHEWSTYMKWGGEYGTPNTSYFLHLQNDKLSLSISLSTFEMGGMLYTASLHVTRKAYYPAERAV